MRHTNSKWKFPTVMTALAAMGAIVVGSAAMQNHSLAAPTDMVASSTETPPSEKLANKALNDSSPEVDLRAFNICVFRTHRVQTSPGHHWGQPRLAPCRWR